MKKKDLIKFLEAKILESNTQPTISEEYQIGKEYAYKDVLRYVANGKSSE